MFNLFKRKKEDHKGSQYTSLKIREIVRETPDTVTIYFEQPEPYLEYKAGQYLTVILDINGKEERRSYSLCTSPYVDPHPGITVKRVRGGLVSNYLNDQLRPGKTIEIMKPMGHFTTDYHSQNQRHFVMIAGGSGITPIMGITKSVLINEPQSKVTLIYCSRSENEIIFKKALEDLESKYEGRLMVIHNLSQPSDSWTGLKGRLDSQKIKDILSSISYPELKQVEYFLCGPEGIMETAESTLLGMGVDSKFIHKESFYSNLEAKEEELKAAGKLAPELTREVEVILEGETYHFEVPAGKTILEAGLDHDVDMPYSCQSGLCTACRGKLLSGKVDMIEDAGLSKSEIEEGYILCCSSKPASSDVKIIIE
ncbi:ferredoxin--NADP reductase [Cecembia calidifontis]|uniref:Ring-1,2-phenylacetyl-CoA epoxidase subunit PaaE n=1 Tax=Cecembia calidifontis TaxID=1187080 RepID=A0A4Q7PAZ6_9BACT|nr:ferredoxin--NADP reductase [Cecembia calidifontis]RZS96818.1 ring-1,2-phenylacetyl-CoA epoxidase subunit PaaE [Cecembia calidifontis]